MPDITAARPTSGAPIESSWGGQVHDAVEGVQAGQATVNIAAAVSGEVTVTFPRAYAATPDVVASVRAGTNLYYAVVSGVTATAVTLRAVHRDGASTTASTTVAWVAVGTPA